MKPTKPIGHLEAGRSGRRTRASRGFRLFGHVLAAMILVATHRVAWCADSPIYLWFEPEWFDGVKGYCEYHSGPARLAEVQNCWGIAGPGISAEWTQGGESEWNSMAAGPNETKAVCQRAFFVPRAGKYKIWVRYYDHRDQAEPFRALIEQDGKATLDGKLGVQPVVPKNDEYSLYWGFSFGWGFVEGDLKQGPATLKLIAEEKCEAWRQLDAVLITDDLNYTPVFREKPPFAYFDSFKIQPNNGASWRGSGKNLKIGASWKRPHTGARDFSMWTVVEYRTNWWSQQKIETLTPYDVQFRWAAAEDIQEKFLKQFEGRKDLPIVSWNNLLPGFRLTGPDLSPDSPVRKWLDRTKIPFFIMTNNSDLSYNSTNGPPTYAALTGALKDQFLGYVSGEMIGPEAITMPKEPLGGTRREHVDALGKSLLQQTAAYYSKGYHATVPESFYSGNIAGVSVHSITYAHLQHEIGARMNAYETDSTNVHVPMRIAFARGAARQYRGGWMNYASGNFGDACATFFQEPHVPRGAKAWFHSKYSITDGPPVSWYRKLYYLNYLSGASATFWEQCLHNQWMKPGPGEHPVQLSPFGRATVDFQAFVDRLPDRGEPYTPIAALLSYGHGYDSMAYECKMMNLFPATENDRELRELFNVFWFPSPIFEGRPATPSVQNLMSGKYGNLFDVLVDRPSRMEAILDYPIVWAAGDVELGGKNLAVLEDYVTRGGTLVVNAVAAKNKVPPEFLGVAFKNDRTRHSSWIPGGGQAIACTPYSVEEISLKGARALASATPTTPLITRHAVGEGAVILTLVPHMTGYDERAHPALPWLLNGLTEKLLPVEVTLADGRKPNGEIMYQLNKTTDGWLVSLFNNQGIDKTQHGLPRVDRNAFVDVALKTRLPVKSADEFTEPRKLPVVGHEGMNEIHLRVHPGDVQVVVLKTN